MSKRYTRLLSGRRTIRVQEARVEHQHRYVEGRIELEYMLITWL